MGSANFTRGGLKSSAETAVLVSHDDVDASGSYAELSESLGEQFEAARPVSETQLAAYRQTWKIQKKRLDRLSGDYPSKSGEKPPMYSPLEVPQIALMWDGENSKSLRKSFGIRSQVTPDNHWSQVIATIQDAPWWRSDQSTKDTIAHDVWAGRAAFLDVLFYDPDKPVADLK